MRNDATTTISRDSVPRRAIVLGTVVSLVLTMTLAACGESGQAKAEKTMCEGRSEVESSVKSLQGLTVENASLSTVKNDLASAEAGLKKMHDATGELNSARKEQVEKANGELSSELSSFTHELTSLTLPQAKAQLTTSVEKLAAGYKSALSSIEC
jgi:hypothetical protein